MDEQYNTAQENEIKVSVLCTVYNHEKFLRKCLDGFVSQKTEFKYEVLINDDKSTDNSKEIIAEYVSKYPQLFIPIYQEVNQFSKGIYMIDDILLPIAKGKYIAICEGDDYWCSEKKLQLQYDYMETHPECSMCLHNTRIHDLSGKKKDRYFNNWNTIYTLKEEDVFFGWSVHTSAYFIRKEFVNLPNFARKYWFGDYMRLVFAYCYGNVVCIPETLSVYNYGNVDGVTVQNNNAEINKMLNKVKQRSEFLEEFNKYTEYRFNEITSKRILEIEFECVRIQQLNVMEQSRNRKDIKIAFNKIKNHPYFESYIKNNIGIRKIAVKLMYKNYYLLYLYRKLKRKNIL